MSSYVPVIPSQLITCGNFPLSDLSNDPERFILYISLADIWSHRPLLAGRLKQIFNRDKCILRVQEVDARDGRDGWYINDKAVPGGRVMIKELYLRSNPKFEGRAILPVLWDTKKEIIVSNDSVEITKILLHGLDQWLIQSSREMSKGQASFTYVPPELVGHMDELYRQIHCVCYGLHEVEFGANADDKDQAAELVIQSLNFFEELMRDNSSFAYLCGDTITLPDILLYPAIIRFDLVHRLLHSSLPTIGGNRNYQYIHDWVTRLYQGSDDQTKMIFQETTHFNKIKSGYASLMPKDHGGYPIYGPEPVKPAKADKKPALLVPETVVGAP